MRWLLITFACSAFSCRAAEGLLTNFFQYSPFATQGMQVCKFPLATNLYDIATTRVLKIVGTTTNEIARQQVASNFLAVVTDIAADSTNQFAVMTNATPASFSGMNYLTVTTNGLTGTNLYQVTNGLTGMQVINTNLTQTSNLFPLVGWQLYDRSWCFVTSKVYEIGYDGSYTTNLMCVTNMIVEIVDSGPLLFQVKVTQLFARQLFQFLSAQLPAGTGSNEVFLTMEAFRPIVIVSHKTDAELWYRFDGNGTVNQFRFRNVDSTYLSSQFGGRIGYQFGLPLEDVANGSNQRDIIMPMLAHVDIAIAASGSGLVASSTNASTTTLSVTSSAGNQGGAGHYNRGSWYVLEDTNSTSASASVYGVGNGPLSLALGNPRGTGFAPLYRTNGNVHGFQFQTEHIPSAAIMYTNSRLNYFLYTGTEAMHTNSSNAHFHPMTVEFAKVNFFSLAKQTDWRVPDNVNALNSRANRGTFTLPRSYLTNLISRLRGGEPGLYDSMISSDSLGQDITRAFNDASGFYSLVLVTQILNEASSLFVGHMQGDGSLYVSHNFLQGSQLGSRGLSRIETIEMLAGFDTVPATLLWKCRLVGLLYSKCVFDEDWYPVAVLGTALYAGSAGTAGMPIQFVGQRRKFSIHYYPEVTNGLYSIQSCIDNTIADLNLMLNPEGAPRGSPHYNTASSVPHLENINLFRNRGITNISESSLKAELTNYARWCMSLPTPPEVRFGTTNRYTVQFGDGQWIVDPVFGLLAEVFLASDEPLSKALQWQWGQIGKAINTFFVPGVLTIRFSENWTSNAPVSGQFANYYGALHAGVGTRRESALWMINGSWQNDHINYYESGMPSYYLLGAPVGVLRNIYSGGVVSPAGLPMLAGSQPVLSITLSGTNQMPYIATWPWATTPTNTIFAAFPESGIVDCKMTTSNDIYHTTAVLVSTPSQNFAVALLDDRWTNNTISRYVSHSLNVTGNVAGAKSIIPYDESYPTLPSVGQTNFVGAGLSVFSLTNAGWPNHPDGGVMVQVAAHLKDESNQVSAVYYKTSTSPGETNLHLRFITSNNTTRAVVARRVGLAECTISTNVDTGAFYIVNGTEEMRVGTNTWDYSLGTATNVAAVLQGTATLTATNGIVISGGTAECYSTNGYVRTAVSAGSGVRTITPKPEHLGALTNIFRKVYVNADGVDRTFTVIRGT